MGDVTDHPLYHGKLAKADAEGARARGERARRGEKEGEKKGEEQASMEEA